MMRLVIQTILTLIANAVGLLVASYVLDDFTINASSFILALVIFTAATVLLGPFIAKMAMQNASFLMGGIALVTTLVGLLITTAVTDGLDISGLTTWFLATVVIWIASVLAQVILPFVVAKIAIARRSDDGAAPPPPATNRPASS
ncbi:MAG: phage holin family protein [Thermomicrobiales bacterium]|nr:phage holin family protein [Thermomicrobiales bacterium]